MAEPSAPEISTVIYEPPCRLNLDRHFSYHPLHKLEAGYWLTKLVSLLSIFNTGFETTLGNANTARCYAEAGSAYAIHGIPETSSYFPKQVLPGHHAICEPYLTYVTSTRGQHPLDVRDGAAC